MVPKAKGEKKRLHSMPPVRSELAPVGDAPDLQGQAYLSVDPRLSRQEAAHMGNTTWPTAEQKAGGAE